MKTKFWKIPSSYKNHHRSASLLELFFDILIVVLLGGAIHGWVHIFEEYNAHGEFSYKNAFYIFLQVVTVLFMWRNFMIYSTRYDSNNTRHRVFTMIIMLFVSFMDVSIYIVPHDEETKTAVTIIDSIGMLVSLLLIAYMNLSASWKAENKYEKQFLKRTSFARVLSALLMVIGFTLYGTSSEDYVHWISLGIWSVNLVIWVTLDFLIYTKKYYANTELLNVHLIQERYSVLLIIFMGEMSIQAITNIAMHTDNLEEVLNGIKKLVITMVIIFAWWWFFKEFYNYPDIAHRSKKIMLYTYSMMGIFVSIMISSTGISLILNKEGKLENIGKYTLAFGIFAWHIFEWTLSKILLPFNKADKWILPKVIIKAKKFSVLIFITLGTIVFIPGLTGFIWLVIVMSYSGGYIFFLEVWKYLIIKNKERNEKEFEEYYQAYLVKEAEWIEKYVVKYLDKDLHAKAEYDLNIYSKLIKS